MKGYWFSLKAFVKKYWDEAAVYVFSLVGVWYALLKLAELSGNKFHPSVAAIIGAVVISMAVTWVIENRHIKWGKIPGDVDASLKGRRGNLVLRLVGAWFCGAVGQIALPQLLDAGVRALVGVFGGATAG